MGKKLTEYELHLYEYSAFSLSEEVDLFYCTHKQAELAQVPLDLKKLRSKTQFILEILEQEPVPLPDEEDGIDGTGSRQQRGLSESQKMRERSIQELYILSMGEYQWDDADESAHQSAVDLKFKKTMSNQMINRCDGLRTICLLLNRKIQEMAAVEQKSLHDCNIGLELELRMVCNIMINFLIYNNDDDSMIRDFTNLDYLMEETCFKAIQLSLDTAFVPARKIILIFHIYMRYLFGEKVESPEHKAFYSNLKYLAQYIDFHNFEKTPRH